VRSIFAKVVFWSLVTLLLSLAAYWTISHKLERRGPPESDPFFRMNMMIKGDVTHAFEEGGPDRLAAQLRKLDAYLPGEHLLTDGRGRDLVTGTDRSELLQPGTKAMGPPRLADGRCVFVSRKRHDGNNRYRFIAVVPPWFEPPNILPYYGAIVVVIAGMGAILAAHLVVPLSRLRRVVDRFGRGDLSARVGSTRPDEIGELSRAFDEMAERIQTLLAAERRLLQDVSHELRSPLARLVVAVDLVSPGDAPIASIDRIKRDIGRLSLLVSELLQLTRAEGDPATLDLERVDLGTLLRDLADDCSLEAEAKAVRLDLRLAASCQIEGERELLHRAVENAVRNAIRHAPANTPVAISLDLTDETATITVSDHGPGVPDALLESIFQPFFRVDGHRSRAIGGVGLGLAIARRAVNLHQGSISARNADPGLVITIELPLSRPLLP
jgi:signal transduction histidine kinase